jgi:hypothetical protein
VQYRNLYPRRPSVDKEKRLLGLGDFPVRQDAPAGHHIAYLAGHGLTRQAVQPPYAVYYTPRGLCFVTHNVLGYQERITDPAAADALGTRFMFPAGMALKAAIYFPGAASRLDHLVIVEGTTDALALASDGYRAASVLGSNITFERIQALRGLVVNPAKVYYVPDNDLPGIKAVGRLAKYMFRARLIRLPLGKKDVCDFKNTDERVEYFSRWIAERQK